MIYMIKTCLIIVSLTKKIIAIPGNTLGTPPLQINITCNNNINMPNYYVMFPLIFFSFAVASPHFFQPFLLSSIPHRTPLCWGPHLLFVGLFYLGLHSPVQGSFNWMPSRGCEIHLKSCVVEYYKVKCWTSKHMHHRANLLGLRPFHPIQIV